MAKPKAVYGTGPNTYEVEIMPDCMVLVHADAVTHEKDGSLSFVQMEEYKPRSFKRRLLICFAPGTWLYYSEVWDATQRA